MLKKIFLLMLLICLMPHDNSALAKEKILFIPHDNRPISYQQTAEVIQQLGYEILLPPKELLSVENSDEHPDELWAWLEKNSKSARAAVIASDSMLYGGLIPSRKHEIDSEIISARLENFKKLHADNPKLKIYIFGAIMRTPHTGTPGDIEEPSYYAIHGANIFEYTSLLDKQEISGLTIDEKNLIVRLEKSIPAEILSDWFERRQKNFDATKKLIDFVNAGVINYLVVGRDDNSPLSQTHRENRELLEYAAKNNTPETKFKSLAGIDEFNLLLLTRAVNEMRGTTPKIFIHYNKGKGAKTIPPFSAEPISNSINDEVKVLGGKVVETPKRADFILLVNTDFYGETFWAHNRRPDGSDFTPNLTPSASTKLFANMVEDYINDDYAVGVADINFANGSDNALMKILQDKNLLFKLQSYAGWNTATNSTGFALATGVLSKNMNTNAKNKLLARRYLDDWAYQANIRTIVGNKLNPVSYYQFNDERAAVEAEETRLMNEFVQKNLPPFAFLRDLKVTNPWNRMFECEIEFEK